MTQNLKIFLFQIIIFIWQIKDCFYLYSPWNLIVPIKKPSFTFPPQEISHWIMNYIRSNYTPIIISTGVYNNSRCCSFFLFFLSLYSRKNFEYFATMWEKIVRPRLQGKRFFCPLWEVTRRTERKNSSLSLVSLNAADINATPRLSVRSYRTTNVSTFWNASLWQSSSYQNEIIIQPEAIKWNRSKNNHFVMQFLLFIYIYSGSKRRRLLLEFSIYIYKFLNFCNSMI